MRIAELKFFIPASEFWLLDSLLITHYSLLLLLDAIHACSGVVYDIAPGFLREAAERLVNELLRLRPGGGGMGIVRGPHGVVCPVEVKRFDEHRLVNEGGIHLPLDIVAG